MYNERKKFFKKKAKGMTKPIMKEGEEQLDELSKKVLGKYMKKASKEAVGLAGDITKRGKKDKGTLNKFKNRVTGVHYAKSAVDESDDEEKSMKSLFELYKPRAKKEKEWWDAHKVEKKPLVPGEKNRFQGEPVKIYDRKNMGRKAGKDVAGEVCDENIDEAKKAAAVLSGLKLILAMKVATSDIR